MSGVICLLALALSFINIQPAWAHRDGRSSGL